MLRLVFLAVAFFGVIVVFTTIGFVFELLCEFGWKVGQYLLMILTFGTIIGLAYLTQ